VFTLHFFRAFVTSLRALSQNKARFWLFYLLIIIRYLPRGWYSCDVVTFLMVTRITLSVSQTLKQKRCGQCKAFKNLRKTIMCRLNLFVLKKHTNTGHLHCIVKSDMREPNVNPKQTKRPLSTFVCVSKVKLHSCLLSDIYLYLFYDFPGFENISCYTTFLLRLTLMIGMSCNPHLSSFDRQEDSKTLQIYFWILCHSLVSKITESN